MKLMRVTSVLVVIFGLNLQVKAAQQTDLSRPTATRPTNTVIAFQSLAVSEELSSLSAEGVGTLTFSSMTQEGQSVGLGIRVEDGAGFVDSIEIDTQSGEMRAFGLSLRPVRDANGAVSDLIVTAAEDNVILSVDGYTEPVSTDKQRAEDRLASRFTSANGPMRVQRFAEILAALTPELDGTLNGRSVSTEVFSCFWDIIDIIAAWVGVVLVCGATNVAIIPCLVAIALAIADTIANASQIGDDCMGRRR